MLVQLSMASRMKLLRPSAAELQYKVRKLVDNWFRTLSASFSIVLAEY